MAVTCMLGYTVYTPEIQAAKKPLEALKPPWIHVAQLLVCSESPMSGR